MPYIDRSSINAGNNDSHYETLVAGQHEADKKNDLSESIILFPEG